MKTNTYTITQDDIVNRVYFITKLVQNQTGTTMQGALTSKSDSMGGIFDRFINTLSDALVFNKIIFKRDEFVALGKTIRAIEDFYYYKPTQKIAGIAPDIFGVEVDGKKYPFTVFNNKWEAVANMPQIEVKTFKAKDQMISLRNQNYDDMYLILVELELRIDYLVPFLDSRLLKPSLLESMVMDDSMFIKKDDRRLISRISEIDFSNKKIGYLRLISITNAKQFMEQSTLCKERQSIFRMKQIEERKILVKIDNNETLDTYAEPNNRVPGLYKFRTTWKTKMNIPNETQCLDFSATNIDKIKILKFNKKGIVISPNGKNCSFNETELQEGKQYTVSFETLDRSGSSGEEYFLQKQCACHLTGLEDELTKKILSILQSN